MNPSLQQCQKPQEKAGTQKCCTSAGLALSTGQPGLGSAERSCHAAPLTGAKGDGPCIKACYFNRKD